MNTSAQNRKQKKLLFEFYPIDAIEGRSARLPESKINALLNNGVRTVFIVSSEAVERDSYIRLVHEYRNAGFLVRNVHIERLDNASLHSVRNAVKEIRRCFAEGSCFFVSYGRSYVGVIITCFLIYTGRSVNEAIDMVSAINGNLLGNDEERRFVDLFQQYLGVGQKLKAESEPLAGEAVLKETPGPSALSPADTYVDSRVVKDAIPGIDGKQRVSVRKEGAAEKIEIAAPRERKPVEAPVEEKAAEGEEARDEAIRTDFVEEEFFDIAGEIVQEEILPEEEIEGELTEEVHSASPLPAAEPPIRKESEQISAVKEEIILDDEPPSEERVVQFPSERHDTVDDQGETAEVLVVKGEAQGRAAVAVAEPGTSGPFYTSLRFKLISIISAIIILSLSGMIFLATYFFKKDNEIRVQENNHKISELISLKVKTDVTSLIEKSKLITEKLAGSSSNVIPPSEKDFLFIGIAERSRKGGLRFIRSYLNTPVMDLGQISRENISGVHRAYGTVFARSLNGEQVIHNISQGLGIPAMGISVPLQLNERGDARSILISYIKLDDFLEAFRTAGITKAFLVNDRGDVVAHPDSTIVLSEANYINIPIVEKMTKSTLDNGQTRYRDEKGVFHLGSFKKIDIGGCGVIATVNEEKAFQEVYNIQRRNVYIMIIILTVVIVIVFFFGQSVTNPIIRLVDAARKIKEGIFRIDIKPATRDEVGVLTNAFIEMGAGLEEREKIKTAFGKFVNPELAELVLKDEIRLGGERKTVTILFSDIRNFTAISEKLNPEEVVEFLNDYMTRMVGCIDRTDGVVDKFIGDAIMALWGVPLSKGNDTENAVNAALMMRKSLFEFNQDRGGERNPIIKIGCGINTGPVLAGQIGSENRMEYTVIGDTVNLASRIEELNKPFGTDILISEDSYNLVKEMFAVEQMAPIKVKGKDKPQQIYAVLGRQDDAERPKSVDELRDLLGTTVQPFNRRAEDGEGEAKYEIL